LFQPGPSAPLSSESVLPKHCFYHDIYNEYYNENGNIVKKTKPCGELGIYGDIAIEELIHDALTRR
jgi:hypothetical protein